MHIAVLASIRLPTEKAHGYAIMRMCAAWQAEGHVVTLYVPYRVTTLDKDPFEYYSLPRTFTVVRLRTFDWIHHLGFLGPLAFFLQTYGFVRSVIRSGMSRSVAVFTRETLIVPYLARHGYNVFLNIHTWNHRWWARRALRRATGIMCISDGALRTVRQQTLAPACIVRSGTDTNPCVQREKTILRKELGVPEHAFVAVYTGHLFSWKGIDTLVDAARYIRKNTHIHFLVIGGMDDDVTRYRAAVERDGLINISFLGHIERAHVQKYTACADALLLPNTRIEAISELYTSPLKLFEYMASGTPIIASDLPSIREILNEDNAFLVRADNAHALSEAIEYVRDNEKESRRRAQRALRDSGAYSWEAQAKIASEFMRAHSR